MRHGAWVVIVCALVGWAAAAGPLVEALRPEIGLSMEADGVVRIRSWVAPVGPAGYRDRPAEMQWTLVPQIGSWRIVAAFADVLSLDAGEVQVFADWRIRLPVGGYTLTWGDLCEGHTVVSFSVAEDASGKMALIAPQRFLEPVPPFVVAVADEPAWTADSGARRAAAWARASLAEDLAVCTKRIEVTEVLARAFPDTSLGVREPGMMYAQVITPGYVVRLSWKEREFEYRVAGERLVRVPDLPTGRAPDDVWVVQVFVYHAGVDLLIHGDLACSPAAVLPVTRWVPVSDLPIEGALALLVSRGLAPWEVEAGYSSEFPLAQVALEDVLLEGGVLIVTLSDPEHRASGGACRTGILRAQIEKTARQFSEVREVRVLPPEVLQP